MSRQAANSVLGDRIFRNLRDLQLDDELDFPDVGSHTFDVKDSVHNQALRIRKAEWLFYYLFHFWDPAVTKELGEFFPAYDPKQSLDLRGAIFHHLSVLKKDGIFPKELILRKTMFDECKGPKFEELLAAFSTSVLLKVLDKDGEDKSMLKNVLLGDKSVEVSDLQLWDATYRSSLSNSLQDRLNLRRRWHRFGRVLKVKEDEIKQRRREHELKAEENKQTRIPKRRLDRLDAHIQRDWATVARRTSPDRKQATSTEWTSILLKGDQHMPDRSLLERPYKEVWQHASEDSLYHFRPEKARSSLQRLEYHIDKQNQRLAKWRETKKMLDQTSSPPPTKPATPATPRRAASTERSGSPELGTTPYERGGKHNRGVSRDVTPPRPSTAKRRASNHQSPLSLMTSDLNQLGLRDRVSPGPASARPPSSEQLKPLLSASEKSNRRRSNTVIYSPQVSMSSRSSMDGLNEGYESPTGYFDDVELDHDATDIINSVLHADPSPSKPSQPLSLTERARMSMAPPPPGGASRYSERARSTSPTKQEPHSLPRERPTSMALDERTRQSMSFLAQAMAAPPPSDSRPSTSRRVTVTKRSSRSPEKRSKPPRSETPDLTHVDESFLAENIDEDTIFMSRPRVAHSPPLHPVSSREEEYDDADVSLVDKLDRHPDDESVEDFS